MQQAGLSCVEYVEQLTMLLYLKMADQLTEEPYNQKPIVPPELGWKALLKRDKLSLDLFWIKDKSLTDTDSLPAPDIIAFTSTGTVIARMANAAVFGVELLKPNYIHQIVAHVKH